MKFYFAYFCLLSNLKFKGQIFTNLLFKEHILTLYTYLTYFICFQVKISIDFFKLIIE